jgi:hypothetical protein
MVKLGEWEADIAAAVGDLSWPSDICISPIDLNARLALTAKGFFGVLPLWREAEVTAGLLALPNLEPTGWPGIIEKGGQALTLSSDAGTILPRFLMSRFLSNNIAGAKQLSKAWPEAQAGLSALHAVLGGMAETLEVLADVINDSRERRAFEYDAGVEGFETAHSILARRIDRSEQFSRFADWMDASIAGDPLPRESAQAYGPWARQLYVRAAGLPDDLVDDLPQATLLELLETFAGIDTAVPNVPTWEARPGAGSGQAALVALAARIDLDSCPNDPVAAGLLRALRVQGVRYDGYAHAEAVVARDEGGQPERAWGTLHSAAWWAARSIGEAPSAMLDGARLLADRSDWKDIRWVIDRAAGSSGE